ncbi:MAG: transglutaminase family protein, partial [Candidatus Xenobia bacterium]
VDVTGNTHRAEFCIDKLYSPDHAGGRQGIAELRCFEMAPHAQMKSLESLLVRSLVARFWERSYEVPLVPWDHQLHDRFMLPHFLAEDFRGVLADLEMPWEWFVPHYEFRFPQYGESVVDTTRIELRQAVEPWYVLGEEGGSGGTVRNVDSSVERVQVRVENLTETRHALLCNGRRVPLYPTGRAGEFVAGVRFRAWQPPSCMHPTIGVHTPLVFDLVDLWNGRTVGGCTYHVSHPGGRSWDGAPVNPNEAEGRRLARFHPFGSLPHHVEVASLSRLREYPMTLDLRR